MQKPFVPDTFAVPATLETTDFRLRMLGVRDVVKDYDAVMTSIDHLHANFHCARFGDWPYAGMTLEDDLADLGWHQVEFKNRTSFTYTVVTPDESRCLGCVYIFPGEETDSEAEVFLWVRASDAKKLDAKLFEAVRSWMKVNWPFTSVAYPGRQ